MQAFLVSLPKILNILGSLAKKSKKMYWIFFHDLENSSKFLRTLPRSWQEISKIQKFSWQKNQDAKHWVVMIFRVCFKFSCHVLRGLRHICRPDYQIVSHLSLILKCYASATTMLCTMPLTKK